MSVATFPSAWRALQRALAAAKSPAPLLRYAQAQAQAQAEAQAEAATQALAAGLQLAAGVALLCWIASVLTRNYSHVDRVWSVTPPAFAWHFAAHARLVDGAWDARLALMAALASLWGLRLTFNFWRKGGYRLSEEDYRWAVVRQHLHPALYQLFNAVFIAGYQNLLLFLIALPSYAAYVHRGAAPLALNGVDGLAAVLFLGFLALETVADQQQWNFYQAKYALIAAKKPLSGDFKAGFNRSGLFKYSRHANFFGEFSLWWAFYLFSVVPTGVLINPSVLGAALLTLLFVGSTQFTEYITASKYPEYREYQASVSKWVPLPPRAAPKRGD